MTKNLDTLVTGVWNTNVLPAIIDFEIGRYKYRFRLTGEVNDKYALLIPSFLGFNTGQIDNGTYEGMIEYGEIKNELIGFDSNVDYDYYDMILEEIKKYPEYIQFVHDFNKKLPSNDDEFNGSFAWNLYSLNELRGKKPWEGRRDIILKDFKLVGRKFKDVQYYVKYLD